MTALQVQLVAWLREADELLDHDNRETGCPKCKIRRVLAEVEREQRLAAEMDADDGARLIAAVPVLLEAAKYALSIWMGDIPGEQEDAVEALAAAIAQAEGGAA